MHSHPQNCTIPIPKKCAGNWPTLAHFGRGGAGATHYTNTGYAIGNNNEAAIIYSVGAKYSHRCGANSQQAIRPRASGGPARSWNGERRAHQGWLGVMECKRCLLPTATAVCLVGCFC